MGPMAPALGMTGSYVNPKHSCFHYVEITEVEELSSIYPLKLKVLKNLNKSSECPHEEGEIFSYDMPKVADPSQLETLILE